jgi:hypothetical protein
VVFLPGFRKALLVDCCHVALDGAQTTFNAVLQPVKASAFPAFDRHVMLVFFEPRSGHEQQTVAFYATHFLISN